MLDATNQPTNRKEFPGFLDMEDMEDMDTAPVDRVEGLPVRSTGVQYKSMLRTVLYNTPYKNAFGALSHPGPAEPWAVGHCNCQN
jgi:hypothetical protein